MISHDLWVIDNLLSVLDAYESNFCTYTPVNVIQWDSIPELEV